MSLVTDSDLLFAFAFWAGATALSIAVALVACILVLRLGLTLRMYREARFVLRWRPRLLEAIDQVPATLPAVKRGDWFAFLALWNHFQESLRGAARHRLRAVMLKLRMDVAAREMLKSRSIRERLMSVITLGHLGDQESWPALERLAHGPHTLLSLAAARALLLIDPVRALNALLPELSERPDWPVPRLEAMLSETGPAAVSAPLAAAVDRTPSAQLPKLIALLDAAHAKHVRPKLRELLQTSHDPDVLAACLKSRHLPLERVLIRPCTHHESWQVRTQAASAMARVAQPGDEKLLAGMLKDPVWWVRYRAAQALAALPFLTRDDLWRLRFVVTDRFAQNMLDQVVAERGTTRA
ncbi:MAG: HEAT repeat domain-containing protein [Burkholderiales bacterium]